MMAYLRTFRRLRVALLGFFLAAQLGCIAPLIYDHTLNVFETTPVASHLHRHVAPAVTAPDANHHHGVLDLHDQCCTLHTLAGPLPQLLAVMPAMLLAAALEPAPGVALIPGLAALPDRPPRPLPAR